MSQVFVEGELEITFPDSLDVRKFDADYGLSDLNVKAVDFVVEEAHRRLFIEFKDPEHSRTKPENRQKFVERFQSGDLITELTQKCRDTFLYGYCAAWDNRKPSQYYVLLTLEGLDPALLQNQKDKLSSRLVWRQPATETTWSPFIEACAVFNIATWNRVFRDYPIRRLP